jgi:F0F1-type ATP synthase assembly protein I
VKFFTKQGKLVSGLEHANAIVRVSGRKRPVPRGHGRDGGTRGARNMRAGVPVAKKDSRFSFARSVQEFQNNVTRAGPAAAASYSLIGAIVVLGGLGYAADRWFGSAPWGAFSGLMLGLVVGFYELVKAVRR